MLVRIKGYKKVTKNGKEIILPLMEDVLSNRTFFLNRGFDITLQIPDEEIARLIRDGVLWDSSKKESTNTGSTKTEPTDVGF